MSQSPQFRGSFRANQPARTQTLSESVADSQPSKTCCQQSRTREVHGRGSELQSLIFESWTLSAEQHSQIKQLLLLIFVSS